MKLVNRRLMLQEPVSTIYAPWIPNSYVELFVMTGLRGPEDWSSIKLIDGVKTALFLDPVFMKTIPRFEPSPGDSRGQLYLVFEEADLDNLLGRVTAAKAAAPNQPEFYTGD
ncbi:hypothetical protein [Burkholderia phage FLC9]|nr:hypothetical protein [Burkholderia phage FLC9]